MERFRNPRNSLDKLESSEDNTLDRVEHLCPLDNGCHITTSTCNIGALDRLVLELILMTLVQLDIRSLTDFRRVNRRAMQVVDLISPYKKIITQAPIAIRVILSIGAGRWITCLDLYNKLRTQKCEVCGDSGRISSTSTKRGQRELCIMQEGPRHATFHKEYPWKIFPSRFVTTD
ncbi:hypothetical protein AJ80_01592 [Polytolypa hystricis UAMH7299]|uniref:F-box domain-containing protein n=1 Tax=Polytolypa hystricis (strain UAMH7299) TaxID=1447883 RepID=A0A2B7Z1E0_POLH7|nr:hypothetical protein AJ80_01592 [Polytolypa hystricis UAMH7299]